MMHLHRWNRFEMGDILRRLEEVEAAISKFQEHEDQEDGLVKDHLADLRGKLSKHYSLLRQQETLWR